MVSDKTGSKKRSKKVKTPPIFHHQTTKDDYSEQWTLFINPYHSAFFFKARLYLLDICHHLATPTNFYKNKADLKRKNR